MDEVERFKKWRYNYMHSEKMIQKRKEYHKRRLATKIMCKCGIQTDLQNRMKHEKTKRHQRLIKKM